MPEITRNYQESPGIARNYQDLFFLVSFFVSARCGEIIIYVSLPTGELLKHKKRTCNLTFRASGFFFLNLPGVYYQQVGATPEVYGSRGRQAACLLIASFESDSLHMPHK